MFQVTSDRADFAATGDRCPDADRCRRAEGHRPQAEAGPGRAGEPPGGRLRRRCRCQEGRQAGPARRQALGPGDGPGRPGPQDRAGDRRVTVGVLDTGVDASNPDIAPNFNWALSRNFAPDLTDVDGPCEVASCLDPVGTDDGGHGTHVAGTIGAAANGFGRLRRRPEGHAGRAQGRSGLRLLLPGPGRQRAGLRRRCRDRRGQHVVLRRPVAVQLHRQPGRLARGAGRAAGHHHWRCSAALEFAHRHGVTLVGALGNNHEDLGAPRTRRHQPGLPADDRYPRPIDNETLPRTCRSRART